ncbi:MAG: hypothetical protein ACI8Y3_001462 [Paraglaciecola sp.]|jgi:hypothetical protein
MKLLYFQKPRSDDLKSSSPRGKKIVAKKGRYIQFENGTGCLNKNVVKVFLKSALHIFQHGFCVPIDKINHRKFISWRVGTGLVTH